MELRSHVTCRDINVIYYLKCSIFDHKGTYIGKMVGDKLLVLKAESINTLVIVEQIFPIVNLTYTYIIVP